MPELPEVEAARAAADRHLKGQRIVKVNVQEDDKVLVDCTSAQVAASLQGKTVVGTGRKGKHVWLVMSDGPTVLFHFGMTGAFLVRDADISHYKRKVTSAEEWPPRFHKLDFETSDGTAFAFVDSRRFARIRLVADPLSEPPVSELGPDAFLALPSPSSLAALLRERKRAIKTVLMDQAVISGIGNWVADEVLYQTRLHPEALPSSLSDDHFAKLHAAIQEVLAMAVQVDADSSRFPPSWLFHVRWDKKPGKVDGRSLSFITVGGRTSAIVPELQKLPKSSSNPRKTDVQGSKKNKQRKSSSSKGGKARKKDEEESDEEEEGDGEEEEKEGEDEEEGDGEEESNQLAAEAKESKAESAKRQPSARKGKKVKEPNARVEEEEEARKVSVGKVKAGRSKLKTGAAAVVKEKGTSPVTAGTRRKGRTVVPGPKTAAVQNGLETSRRRVSARIRKNCAVLEEGRIASEDGQAAKKGRKVKKMDESDDSMQKVQVQVKRRRS